MSADGDDVPGFSRQATADAGDVLAAVRARAARRAAQTAASPAALREGTQGGAAAGREATGRGRAKPRAFDFSALPVMKELQFTAAAGQVMGVDSPFFRVCEGRGAATARIEGADRINFSSYDYLGLNQTGAVLEAAKAAIDRYGVSCSGSRVVGGERPFHAALERALAAIYDAEDAVAMVSGHATNVTTIGSLMGKEDLVLCDELAHNSALEGARLSGATRRSFPHNDLDWVERLLETERSRFGRVLIVVEGLYSMDGDTPDLARLIDIKNAHDCWLMVDEAHALGVLGPTGRGLAEAQGVDPRSVEIWMGTLSKTLASTGGYIAGSSALIQVLKARAPGFVFSVGLSAPLSAAALAALEVMAREPERVARLRDNGLALRAALRARGLDTGLSEGHAVTPVVLGDSPTAAAVAHLALLKGLSAPPILHPAVPERRARLRFFVSSEHTAAHIERAADIVAEAVAEAPEITARLGLS
ncbi:aminotransferase class I/II-fold pyridoxal phosphate-dependent enzyme [Rubrimonas cliftonensis]|uniref:8-amino-7-oxononanoate synthase n=1 Tax=Rubrimonas cliftonensis TaxID=89524 RepID=A0A1H3ZCG8_9RHOB|nr:aminotransferase class I/II-fold pyridoxal phosphate-dependent enzyme [Rubrimonas cliftonensis]SEA21074.1 8-amino-7-oxononanoate synthase [Rubrimonas cliftonensis]